MPTAPDMNSVISMTLTAQGHARAELFVDFWRRASCERGGDDEADRDGGA